MPAGLMDNLHNRLTFNPCKTNEILYYSYKEHPKISRIAKFGGEMLQNAENIVSQNSRYCFSL